MILRHLKHEGVDVVFGIPGGSISPMLHRFRDDSSPRFIIAAHEGGAAFMADGYARSSGKLGVCAVASGPGVTNAVTGVVSANMDQTPLLLLSGQVPLTKVGTGALQESTVESGVDTVALLAPVTKYSAAAVTVEALPRQLARAISVAQTGRKGAVHLMVPSDLARKPASAQPFEANRVPLRGMRSAAAFASVLDRLKKAKRPLLFLGAGAAAALASNEGRYVRALRRLGVPVTTSVRAKGVFPESDRLSLGVFGIAGHARAHAYAAEGIDVLVVVGSRLGEWAVGGHRQKLADAKTIIHIDIDAGAFGQNVPAHEAWESDAEDFFAALDALVPEPLHRDMPTVVSPPAARADVPAQRTGEPMERDDEERIKSSDLMEELNSCITGDTDVFLDAGNCTGWVTRHVTIDPPTRVFAATGLASMGWSCGAVLGGRVASPHRRALAVVGDGAFMMNGTEVSTGVRQRIGAVYLVLDDGFLGMVNHGESLQTGADLLDPYYAAGCDDLAAFASAMGAGSWVVRRRGELETALKAAFQAADNDHLPQVVVAKVDPTEQPPYGDRFATVAGGH
jgi:acetolactate synthase-1/2/3 large subunit